MPCALHRRGHRATTSATPRSILYRSIITGLRHRFRYVAVDYPGFGLSTAAPGYGFTPAERARVLEKLISFLDLRNITMIVHDRGGPIGFAVATCQPERFTAFVIGNTFASPRSDLLTQIFSADLRRPARRLAHSQTKLSRRNDPARHCADERTPIRGNGRLRRTFPTPESRKPQHVFARQMLASRPRLTEIERRLEVLGAGPAPILWPTRDIAFGNRERLPGSTIKKDTLISG